MSLLPADKQSFFGDLGFENLKTLVEKLPFAIIVIDEQRRVQYINSACERLYAFRLSEVIQKPVTTMLFLSDPSVIEEAVNTALGGKVVFELEWSEELFYEGRVFWRQGSIVPLIGQNGDVSYAVFTILDITQRVRSFNMVFKALEDYRLLFEEAPEAILIMRETQITGTNATAVKVLEYTKEEMTGKHLWQISPSLQYQNLPSPDAAEASISRAMAGESQRFNWQFLTKSGKILETEVSFSPLNTPDTPLQIAVYQAIVRKK
jgi:PAS domain S-box-containing protein